MNRSNRARPAVPLPWRARRRRPAPDLPSSFRRSGPSAHPSPPRRFGAKVQSAPSSGDLLGSGAPDSCNSRGSCMAPSPTLCGNTVAPSIRALPWTASMPKRIGTRWPVWRLSAIRGIGRTHRMSVCHLRSAGAQLMLRGRIAAGEHGSQVVACAVIGFHRIDVACSNWPTFSSSVMAPSSARPSAVGRRIATGSDLGPGRAGGPRRACPPPRRGPLRRRPAASRRQAARSSSVCSRSAGSGWRLGSGFRHFAVFQGSRVERGRHRFPPCGAAVMGSAPA